VGWLTTTVVAVTGSPKRWVDEEVEVGLPTAETHTPAVTSAAEAATVCSKVVAVV
jgi:hypothetical protein